MLRYSALASHSHNPPLRAPDSEFAGLQPSTLVKRHPRASGGPTYRDLAQNDGKDGGVHGPEVGAGVAQPTLSRPQVVRRRAACISAPAAKPAYRASIPDAGAGQMRLNAGLERNP